MNRKISFGDKIPRFLRRDSSRWAIPAIILLLIIPTFWRMLRPGIFSFQDIIHIFRLYEYHKCVLDFQIPCRWASDIAFGYGEPVFNFYGQGSYLVGEIFRMVGFSVLDTLKALFILSLGISALTMFLLAKRLWGNNWSAIISALVYTYAPYRSVDIYVRGALPEALSFIFFPLISYFFYEYVLQKKVIHLFLFGLTFAGLILTHNLSALMYSIFLFFWGAYLLIRYKALRLLPYFLGAGVGVACLTAFYLLPALAESRFTTIDATTEGYFRYINHFAALNQLLISRLWTYNGSAWMTDNVTSRSVGQVQWILPLVILVVVLIKKSSKSFTDFFVLFFIGWLMLFMIHNRSTFVWELIEPLKYLQFPWRFLGLAVFSFALSAGALIRLVPKNFLGRFLPTAFVIAALIALNTGFFFEDLWFNITDKEQFSGEKYLQIASASISDFWPKFGSKMPTSLAPKDPRFLQGTGSASLIKKRTASAFYQIDVSSKSSEVQFPIAYFPGWEAVDNGSIVGVKPTGDLGLAITTLGKGEHLVKLSFENTPVRSIGNLVSALSLLIFSLLFVILKRGKKV